MNRIKIGVSGSDERFYELGYKSTVEMPTYIKGLDLDCFEYSFGKGVRLSYDTRKSIKEAFEKENIEISVHAPYFINFANPDNEKIENTNRYLMDSVIAAKDLGASRVVFHPGSFLKSDAETAFNLTYQNLSKFVELYGDYLIENDIYICPETMGKSSQVGTVEEVAKFSTLHRNILPCIDFGHINARFQGYIKSEIEYQQIVDTLSNYLDDFKVKNMHVHFSKIEYGAKGEIRHLTFSDNVFGPDFEPFAKVIVDNSLTPYIVSESAGTQGQDAVVMKKVYTEYYNK